MPRKTSVDEASQLQNLAEFRYELRRFLQFSEARAVQAGLHPQQHQLLLQLAGVPYGTATTVSYAAEKLGLKHHTVVELSMRCEEAGLLRRIQDTGDRRRIQLTVTDKGRKMLRSLSDDHARELYELAPRLIRSLALICDQAKPSARNRKAAAAGNGR
jgi:DNA-binding MarR family transcriptional regulator